MFYTNTSQILNQSVEARQNAQLPLHNIDDNAERPRQPSEADTTNNNTERTWGERDLGGPVNLRHAMQDYEELRRELSHLSRTRSKKSTKSTARPETSRLHHRISRGSQPASLNRDIEAEAGRYEVETPLQDSEEDEFELGDFLKDGYFEKRKEGGQSAKKVGLVFKNLTVQGVGATATFVKTLPSSIIGVSFLSRIRPMYC